MMKFSAQFTLCLLMFLCWTEMAVHAAQIDYEKDVTADLRSFAAQARELTNHSIMRNADQDGRADVDTTENNRTTTQRYSCKKGILPAAPCKIDIIKGKKSPDAEETWSESFKAERLGDCVTFCKSPSDQVTRINYRVVSREVVHGICQEIFPNSYVWGLALGILGCVGIALKSNEKIYTRAAVGSGACLALIGLAGLLLRYFVKKAFKPLNLKKRPALVEDNTGKKVCDDGQRERRWSNLQYLYGQDLYGQDDGSKTAKWYVFFQAKISS